MKISFVKGSWGDYKAFVDGEHQEFKGFALDREKLLLKILAKHGIEVEQETEWYTNGKRSVAKTSNMTEKVIWTEG